jgi:hypothetical protein
VTREKAARYLGLGLGLLALVGYLNAQSYVGRLDLRAVQVDICARNLLGAADNIAGDEDDASFRREAADARERDGNRATAEKYRANARRAAGRAESRKTRLLGADLRRGRRTGRASARRPARAPSASSARELSAS